MHHSPSWLIHVPAIRKRDGQYSRFKITSITEQPTPCHSSLASYNSAIEIHSIMLCERSHCGPHWKCSGKDFSDICARTRRAHARHTRREKFLEGDIRTILSLVIQTCSHFTASLVAEESEVWLVLIYTDARRQPANHFYRERTSGRAHVKPVGFYTGRVT